MNERGLMNWCPSKGCTGDARYAAPGRGHVDGCEYPVRLRDEGNRTVAMEDILPPFCGDCGYPPESFACRIRHIFLNTGDAKAARD